MPFNVFAASRPIRDAFLLSEQQGGDAACDGLVKRSLETWGGRRSLMAVLKEDGSLSEDAWQELIFFDSDRLYSFAPLSDDLLTRLDETLAPWLIRVPEAPGAPAGPETAQVHQDVAGKPTAPVWQLEHINLAGVAVPPTKSNLASLRNRPLLLFLFTKDCPLPLRRFLHRNLGSYEQWFDLRTGEPRLIGWLENLLSGSTVEHRRVGDISSICAVMEEIAGKPPSPKWEAPLSCTVPCELSSIHLSPPFTRGFLNIGYRVVVGSTIQDFALYWRTCVVEGDGAWEAPFRHCLWIPTELIHEEMFVGALKNWLYCFTGQGSSGSRSVELTSASLSEDQLSPMMALLRRADPFVLHTRFSKAEEIETRWRTERLRHGAPRFLPLLNGGNAERLVALEPTQTWELRPPPMIQVEVPDGTWAVDVQIDREQREGGMAGQDCWFLPRRSGRALVADIFRVPARISRNGLFAVQVVTGSRWRNVSSPPHLNLHLPHDNDVLRAILLRSREPWFDSADARQKRLQVKPAATEIMISDAGRKLRGLVEVFGGFWRAQDYWGRTFWRNIFSQMSGRGARFEANLRTQIENTVAKELDRLIGSMPPESRQMSAGRIAQRVLGIFGERLPGNAMTFQEIEAERKRVEELGSPGDLEYVAGDKLVHMSGVRPVTTEEMTEGLEELADLGVLAIGVNLVCPRCRLKTWMRIHELGQNNNCAGCSAPIALIPETPWSYRLNPLVRHCVNSRTLGVWLALSELAHGFGSFFYAPSSELVFPQPVSGGKIKELDILCVTNARLLIGEVKEGDLHETDFSDFAQIAEAIRPDRAVMFVVEEHLNARAQKWFDQFRDRLARSSIRGELFALPAF